MFSPAVDSAPRALRYFCGSLSDLVVAARAATQAQRLRAAAGAAAAVVLLQSTPNAR